MSENNNNLEIQASSTTLGYEGEGGKIGAITALGKEMISKEEYTKTVVKNALKFQEVTEREIPGATFGVSVLASAVSPKELKGITVGSVDYPYYINWGTDFFREKIDKSKKEGFSGLGLGIAFGQELAYAALQAKDRRTQILSTIDIAKMVEISPVRVRTCIETVSIEEELKKIKLTNQGILKEGKSAIWVIEPNKKVGDATLTDFLEKFERIKSENPGLTFGIDLDLGGLPKEDKSLLEILDRLQEDNLLPVFVSLSGKEYKDGDVVTHLPLGQDKEYNKMVGDWFKRRQLRGLKTPGIVIETSPAQQDVLKDYQDFLKAFKG